jgi:hypothetical protein
MGEIRPQSVLILDHKSQHTRVHVQLNEIQFVFVKRSLSVLLKWIANKYSQWYNDKREKYSQRNYFYWNIS